MLCNIKPVPFHESNKHIFTKIPRGGGEVRTPGPPLWIRPWAFVKLAASYPSFNAQVPVSADDQTVGRTARAEMVRVRNTWPITRKGTLWELRKISTLFCLRSSRRLTTVERFRSWQFFCVLREKYNYLNCHFEIIELYRPLIASFPFFIILSRSSNKVPFRVRGHIYARTHLPWHE